VAAAVSVVVEVEAAAVVAAVAVVAIAIVASNRVISRAIVPSLMLAVDKPVVQVNKVAMAIWIRFRNDIFFSFLFTVCMYVYM